MSPPDDALRVLVIGYGLIGRQRAQALAELDGAVLAATVDPVADDPSQATGAPHHADLGDIAAGDYDAAILAVPHDRAGALAAAVLRAGRPVLIEKPLGMSGQEAASLAELAAGLALPSFVGYNYRFLPAVRMLLEAASAGALGRLRNVDLLLGHGGHPRSAEGWKLDPARAGGGVILDPGVHLLDLLLALEPEIRCTDVQGTRGFWPTGIEEDVVATFRREQLLATMRVSHIRWVNTLRLEVIGEEGYAIAEGRGGNYGPMELRLGRRWAWNEPGAGSQRESEELHEFGSDNVSLRDELEAVLRAWRTGRQDPGPVHPATMAEGRAVTECAEELYRLLT